MSDLWMVRGCQRQTLIVGFMRKVYDAAEESDNEDEFLFSFLKTILHTLHMGHPFRSQPQPGIDSSGRLIVEFLLEINGFASSQAESDLLLVDLFEKVRISAFARFRNAAHREEILSLSSQAEAH